MRIIKCARCGAEVSATSNRQKYCIECKNAVKREKDVEQKRMQNSKSGIYIWIAYGNKYPYLPVAAADTAEELGRIVGVTRGCIASMYSLYQHGKISESKYHKVRIDP